MKPASVGEDTMGPDIKLYDEFEKSLSELKNGKGCSLVYYS